MPSAATQPPGLPAAVKSSPRAPTPRPSTSRPPEIESTGWRPALASQTVLRSGAKRTDGISLTFVVATATAASVTSGLEIVEHESIDHCERAKRASVGLASEVEYLLRFDSRGRWRAIRCRCPSTALPRLFLAIAVYARKRYSGAIVQAARRSGSSPSQGGR